MRRECRLLLKNPMYMFCMVIFPVFVTVFFTSLMQNGQPVDMPVGIVDLDNTATTRKMIRTLDAFQGSKVKGYYGSVAEARAAMQRNDIYAFLYIPKGTTSELVSMRRPKISFYYSSTSLTAGALLFKDLKTVSTLGSAGAVSSVLAAKGLTQEQIMSILQPVVVDAHNINNPSINYNVYLSTMLVPGSLMLFIFLITPYSLGTELKFGTSKAWLATANGNIFAALLGKILPQAAVSLIMMYAHLYYVFGVLGFPHLGGTGVIMLLGLLAVAASVGFGVFIFGLAPSLRMAVSTCTLWAVLSFSLVGTAFPTSAMSPFLTAAAQLFPLRHYFMIYQLNVFNGYTLEYSWLHISALILFAALPLLVTGRIKKVMQEYDYMP